MTRVNLVLAFALVASSLYLVRTAYESRRLYAEIDRARTAAEREGSQEPRTESRRAFQAAGVR